MAQRSASEIAPFSCSRCVPFLVSVVFHPFVHAAFTPYRYNAHKAKTVQVETMTMATFPNLYTASNPDVTE
jgi:hypothetical protein